MKRTKTWKIVGLLAILAVLAGCGGGGGGGTAPPPGGSSNWDQMTWDQDNWA